MADKQNVGMKFFISVAGLIVSIVGVTYALENVALTRPVRILIALVPPTFFVFYIVYLVRGLSYLDEMQKRIHLEALAIAYPTLGIAIMFCEYLRKAGVIAHLMPDHVLVMMMSILGISYIISMRRYQ